MRKWTDDNKSVYAREDLAYKLIRPINLGVIEANEFRNNSHNNENICERKYGKTIQNSRVPYFVDLHFFVYRLVIEIDEDGHPYYENDEMRLKLTENLGFTFIRTNPDPHLHAGFNLDVEIAKIYN